MSKADRRLSEVFRRGSRTYFNSTRFFPAAVRRDVTALYAFVRTADDFVDGVPQDAAGFEAFRRAYGDGRAGGRPSGDPVVDAFLELAGRRAFEPAWVDAFLDSMSMDLTKKDYENLGETLLYVYGSAEVIGLMMARIMGLGDDALDAARLLGRAMQYINFIRDLREDRALGRTYLPRREMRAAGLDSLGEEEARRKPEAFRAFLRGEIARYHAWQAEAEKGYALLPRRYRVPVQTAGDMYKWTARRIEADPFLVFRGAVKPSRARIVGTGWRNLFAAKEGGR
jgi:phytoene synthase